MASHEAEAAAQLLLVLGVDVGGVADVDGDGDGGSGYVEVEALLLAEEGDVGVVGRADGELVSVLKCCRQGLGKQVLRFAQDDNSEGGG